MMIPQSRGTVTLKSSNPSDPPVSNPNFLDHPFDRRSLIDAVRIACNVFTQSPIAEHVDSHFSHPKSMSDEDILDFAGDRAESTWHMSCTAKMGLEDEESSVVDTHFRVKGLHGLRAIDMSAAPFVPNCHTVSWAYQIGEMGAERIIAEYQL
jgi:choline dehydrogenase-like flavoprotein